MDKIWTFQGPIVKIFSCPTYQIQSLLKHNFGRLTKHTRKHNAVTHWHALELHYVDSYRDLTSRHLTPRGRLSTQDYRNIFSDWKMWPWNSDFSRSSMTVGPLFKTRIKCECRERINIWMEVSISIGCAFITEFSLCQLMFPDVERVINEPDRSNSRATKERRSSGEVHTVQPRVPAFFIPTITAHKWTEQI